MLDFFTAALTFDPDAELSAMLRKRSTFWPMVDLA